MKVNEVCYDSRKRFAITFLLESPERLPFESWPGIKNVIEDYRAIDPSNMKKITNNICRYDTVGSVFYWYHQNDQIILGIELEKAPQALILRMIGKDPAYRKKPPYASELYDVILKNYGESICLHSDKTLSDEGFEIWRRLYNDGHNVLVYNVNAPANTFLRCPTLDDFQKYFGDSKEFRDYSYVLCENITHLLNIHSHFNIRKIREDNNLGVD